MPLVLTLLAVAAMVALMVATTSKAWGYVKGQQVVVDLVAIDVQGHKLRWDAAMAFEAMRTRAFDSGVVLIVNRAFATFEEQERLYQLYQAGRGNLAAEPGWSNHQGGIAVDIESAGGTNAAFEWLTAHGKDFGFRRTVSSEPWHWEYRP